MSGRGNLFVISGPSGVGKGTLVSMLKDAEAAWVSVSATTRHPRPGEVDGVDYLFMDKQDFLHKADDGGFLEWAEYSGNCYGTPRDTVESHLEAGEDVILEIEVQGALQVRGSMPEAHLVFIEPPSMEELEARLRGRGTESEEAISKRLQAAKVEMDSKMKYDYVLVNDDIESAFEELRGYMEQER
ncbi:MAG: guanylate kinase [Eggerthellaceae bacterium]|nr:guanylate kinase [Eggerthellaceae bacterium]